MTGPRFEAFLARIYTDSQARAAFLHDREFEARKFKLSAEETEALMKIDRLQLESAARSYESKRVANQRLSHGRDIRTRILSLFRR